MKLAIGWFNKVVELLLRTECYQTTKYLSDREVIRATRRWKPSKRERRIELVLTVGEPNYRERKFIKACKKAGEPFPVRKIQMRPWPKRRSS
jgi:hypothetical protein